MKNQIEHNFMISVPDALALIRSEMHTLDNSMKLPVVDALGFVLSEDVLSPINMPPYRQSAMDGYALQISEDRAYSLIGEIKAGDRHHPILEQGQAVRIFTGAPVPDTANAVIMQEKVKAADGLLTIDTPVSLEENIRPKGEQIKANEIALDKGTKLSPAAIGFLAGLGVTEVPVSKKPSVAVITTGNELIEGEQPLAYGQIYESNGKMLIILTDHFGIVLAIDR